MLIINPLKPFYEDINKKIIRMGNFKDTAKEIEYQDAYLNKLFERLKEPILKEELVSFIREESQLSEKEVTEAIEYLIDENFIVNYEEYNEILNNKLSRQSLFFSMASEKIGHWNLESQPNILVLGLGGIGSNVSIVLSRAGFNNFTLVDCDKVEESNLVRQFPYDQNDVGEYKTIALKNKIQDNKNQIKLIDRKIEKASDIEYEISKCEIVICTLDKPYRLIRRIINNLCVKYNKPVIFSGFSEHVAMIGPFVYPGKSACLKCIERNTTEKPLNNVINVPSYGPLCLLISSIVANEVINYFYKFNSNNLIGKTLMFNILTYDLNMIKWKQNKDCEVCSHDSK